ncbi:MAG: prepilin-type N-terminal cleavage/methylation domain-containing protein [Puniceicoccales bacterium]|nr:prepilin-type N-terminal cleavage/methylation domain-containing protein [Puniceicoccales bacterium]
MLPMWRRRLAFWKRAFTMMELLIALALIGIVSSIVVVSVDDLLNSAQKPSPLDTLRKAVDTTWYGSATGHGQMTLEYDEESGALIMRNAIGEAKEVFTFEDADVGPIRFLRAPDMSGGTLQMNSSEPFPFLIFSPWGGVTTAIIEMEIGKERYRYQLETFSGALEAVK